MSALGQKQTFALQKVMSALPPKADTTCGGYITKATNLGATIFELLQQVESRTNVYCFGLTEEERQEKHPIMSRILKNVAGLALMVGALFGTLGTSDAQTYRYYNIPPGPPIVLTALWRLCLLAAAITQTRSIIIKGAFNHPRPSSTRVVINWSRSQSPRITHSAWRPNWPRPAARATPQHAPAITRADKFFH